MPPISLADRSPLLKPLIFEIYGKYARLLMDAKVKAQTRPLFYFLEPWIDGKNGDEHRSPEPETRVNELLALGFDGASYHRRLKEILQADNHLRECCGFDAPLMDHIDGHLGLSLPLDLMRNEYIQKAESAWNDFAELTYASPLRRMSYTHLFNLKSEEEVITLGNARIESLSRDGLAALLGESIRTLTFFHRPGQTEFFLVFEDSGWGPSLREWLAEKQRNAKEITLLLQLFKSGVVHTTYTIPFFSPSWVNLLWSRIVTPTYLGTFRGIPYRNGLAPYTLNHEDAEGLRKWIAFYGSPECETRLSSTSNKFGQMILRSAEYYLSSLSREKAPERLVDLAIALESMFTPSSAHTELTFRIAQNLSQLIGSDSAARKETNRLAKKLYERRSELLHGQYDYTKYARGEFVTDDENDAWSDLIRVALTRLAVLYFRGTADRESFLAELSSAALDQSIGERIRLQSDPENFLSHFV